MEAYNLYVCDIGRACVDTRWKEIFYFFFCLAVYLIKDIINVFMHEAESYSIVNMKTNFIEHELFSNCLNMDKGNGQGSSKNPFPNLKPGSNSPINYGDYDWSSDSDGSVKASANPSIPDASSGLGITKESKLDLPRGKLPELPKLQIKSPLEAFKESIDKASPQELQTKINDLSVQLDTYLSKGLDVPAAKSQIEILEKKMEICFNKISGTIEKGSITESGKSVDLKGKGKEIDLKGKGKEIAK